MALRGTTARVDSGPKVNRDRELACANWGGLRVEQIAILTSFHF